MMNYLKLLIKFQHPLFLEDHAHALILMVGVYLKMLALGMHLTEMKYIRYQR